MYDWELTDDALKAWMRLRQASEALDRVLETELDRRGTTLPQIDVLSILDASTASLTPGDIASYVFRQQHSVSAQLSRMWRSGLVRKTRSKQDQRVVHVKATPKGKELLERTKQAGVGQERELLKSALSDQELRQLDKLLKKVRDRAMDQLGAKAERMPAGFDASRFESI